jgi:hypothetical protein
VAKDNVKFLSREFVGVKSEVVRRIGFAKPLHVVLYEDLNNLAVNLRAALQRFPNPAAGGHVCTELHNVPPASCWSVFAQKRQEDADSTLMDDSRINGLL